MMKKSDITVGKHYWMRVSGSVVEVRLDEIIEREGNKYKKGGTVIRCTNLKTGKTVGGTPARLRSEVGASKKEEARVAFPTSLLKTGTDSEIAKAHTDWRLGTQKDPAPEGYSPSLMTGHCRCKACRGVKERTAIDHVNRIEAANLAKDPHYYDNPAVVDETVDKECSDPTLTAPSPSDTSSPSPVESPSPASEPVSSSAPMSQSSTAVATATPAAPIAKKQGLVQVKIHGGGKIYAYDASAVKEKLEIGDWVQVPTKSGAKLKGHIVGLESDYQGWAHPVLGKSEPPDGVKVARKVGGTLADRLKSKAPTGPLPPHVLVQARAGTGKTFTLIVGIINMLRERVPGLWEELTKRLGFTPIPSTQQAAVWEAMESSAESNTIRFVAFSKSIVTEFEEKWGWVIEMLQAAGISLSFSTMHSMGFTSVRRALGKIERDDDLLQEIIADVAGLPLKEMRRTQPVVLNAVEELVSLCKQNLIDDSYPTSGTVAGDPDKLTDIWWAEQLASLAERHDVDTNGSERRIFELVPKVLERCKEPKDRITPDDMVWLPVIRNFPVFRSELLLVDEAQDLNRAQQALAKKAGWRVIYCGDDRQAIFGFAGADEKSLARIYEEQFDTEQGCLKLPLTVTRRCGKVIVRYAQTIVPDFEAHEDNPNGRIGYARYEGNDKAPLEGEETEGHGICGDWHTQAGYQQFVSDGDMIVCRCNAPLVSQFFKFIKAGRKAYILGRDMVKGLIASIEKQKASSVPDLVTKLGEWIKREREKENAKPVPNEKRLISLQDRYDCLLCLTQDMTSVAGVIQRIDSIFTNDKNTAGIRLSSIHKAKGLEARRVFFLTPKGAECPHPMAKSEWQRGQEMNLRYVAITRAIEELVYVS